MCDLLLCCALIDAFIKNAAVFSLLFINFKEFLHHFISAAKQMVETLINVKIDQWMRTGWIALYKAQLRQELHEGTSTKNVNCWRYPKYYAAHFNSKPIQNDDRNHYTQMHAFSNAPTDRCQCVRAIECAQSSYSNVTMCAFHWCAFFPSMFIRPFTYVAEKHMLLILGVQARINRIACFGMHFFRLQQVRGPHQSCIC